MRQYLFSVSILMTNLNLSLLHVDPRCETTTFGGRVLQFVSHKSDDSISRFIPEVIADDGYAASRMERLYAPFIVDIGANLGSFSILAHVMNPTATIISLEPNPMTYLFFRWNLILNCVPFVDDLKTADGARNRGVMPILAAATIDGRSVSVEYNVYKSENAITSASSENGILPKYSLNSPGEFTRKTIVSFSVNKFLDRNKVGHITFLKLDCEGCEYEVFPPLTPFLSRETYFAGELHPCKNGHSCAYSKEAINKVKQDICSSFESCCVDPTSFGAVACGGMGARKSILGSGPHKLNLGNVVESFTSDTDGIFLPMSIFVVLLLGMLRFLYRRRKGI